MATKTNQPHHSDTEWTRQRLESLMKEGMYGKSLTIWRRKSHGLGIQYTAKLSAERHCETMSDKMFEKFAMAKGLLPGDLIKLAEEHDLIEVM